MAGFSTRAKWRSSLSGCRGVQKKVLDNAGIVREAIFRRLFECLTELQRLRRRCRASRGEARPGRLRFISNNLAGWSLVRIVEEELIAVEIIDHQQPIAPRTLLDRNALGLECRAQRVQRGDCG